MNNFNKFLIFYIFYLIFHESYGRKFRSYTPYDRQSNFLAGTKPELKKVLNVYSESAASHGSPQTEQLFKTLPGIPKETLLKVTLTENKENSESSFDPTNDKTLEMKVGEHLVKVKSQKESKSLASAPAGGGYDISINPKYSHVIEIIHKGKKLDEEHKPVQIYDPSVEKLPLELPKIIHSSKVKQSDDRDDPERNVNLDIEVFSEAYKEDPELFSEADIEDPELFSEADEDPISLGEAVEENPKVLGEDEKDPEVFSEADEEDRILLGEVEENPDEFSEADEEDPEEFSEADEEDPEEFSEADEEDPEEFSEADEEDPEEFNEADEEDPEEFNEADEEDPEKISEADEEEPDVFSESEEKDPEIDSDTDEGNPDEFGKADGVSEKIESEGDPKECGNLDEEESKKFEVSEGDPNEFGVSDFYPDEAKIFEDYPEKLNEVGKWYPDELGGSKELGESEGGSDIFSPNDMLDTKEFLEGDSSFNQNGNEQITGNKEESALNEQFEGSGEEFSDANSLNNSKTGRLLGMFSRQNETFPTCTTPKGEAGKCRRLGDCLLSEALNNFNGFLQQLCLIRGALVGICCPDNPVIETVNPDENATSELMSEDIKQPPEGCGLNTKTRIVGGTISVPQEWTWMVALMRRNRFYCGGVIINNWYILTAAHCVMGMNVKDLTVRLGEYDFNEQSKHTEDLSVSEIKRHAQFVTLTFQHDIALLKLKRSIKYSKFVGSICLPDQKARDYSDVKGTVVGWGTVSFGGAASPILRQVTIPVWKNEDCDRTYLLESIGDSFMCAGSPEKGEDACQGDSGGPLMTVNENGRWEVIGLVSWGRRCGDPTYPGVYTRVTTYLDWIKQNAV